MTDTLTTGLIAPSPLTNEEVRALLAEQEPPCVSLYQPTYASHPETQQDPIRFRNLLDQAERALADQGYSHEDSEAVLGKLRPMAELERFWIEAAGGLATFASPTLVKQFRVRQPLPELVVVSESFHLKPLIRLLQFDERFQILALTRNEVKLYECTRNTIEPVPLTGMSTTMTEALGTEVTQEFSRGTRATSGFVHGGEGDRKSGREVDRDRFFTIVDREIRQRFSNRAQLPLLLAALPEHQSHFREISRNPHLLEAPVAVNPDALSLQELREAAWKAIEPYFDQRLERVKERYGQAQAHHRGSDDIDEVTRALEQGRIGTLLVEAERHVPSNGPASEDRLDDLLEGVLRTGGEVIVLPANRMPTRTGLAAIYRF
jgi:hypothetical protein